MSRTPEVAGSCTEGEPGGPDRRRRLLFALVGLFVLVRVLLALAAPTQLYHSEEYVNLRLAAALLGDADAWPVPPPAPAGPVMAGSLFAYQYQDFDGGTLVVSIVLVPLAALFGFGPFTIKLGALLWALGTLLAWVAVARRLGGPDAGLWTALALVVAPAPLPLVSSVHWGNHAESALFPPLLLLLLLLAGDRERWWSRLLLVAAAGLVAGFGAWFSLLNLLPLALAAALLPLVLSWRTFFALPLFLGSAWLGFLPWFGRNRVLSAGSVGAQGTSLTDVLANLGQPPASHGGADVLTLWPRFAEWELMGLWSWPQTARPVVDGLCRYGIAAVALLALVAVIHPICRSDQRQQGLRRLFVIAVAIGCALGLVELLDRAWELRDRRLAPVYVFGQVLVGLGLASLWRMRRGRVPALVLAAVLLLPNAVGQVGLIASWDRPDDRLRPWIHFALPADHPRLRLEAGVPNVASHEVGRLNRALDELLRTSGTAGREELQGIRLAFGTGGGGEGAGALHRYPPVCPSQEDIDKVGPGAIYMETQARAFGMGLAVRCAGDPEQADAHCKRLDAGLPEVCLSGYEGIPE